MVHCRYHRNTVPFCSAISSLYPLLNYLASFYFSVFRHLSRLNVEKPACKLSAKVLRKKSDISTFDQHWLPVCNMCLGIQRRTCASIQSSFALATVLTGHASNKGK